MINPEELRSLTERANNGYLLLALLALALCWLLFLAWRNTRVRTILATIPLSFPEFSIAGILLVGLIVRLPRMFDSLWYDESFTARIASLSVPQASVAILSDVHPPLWYALEWLWTRLAGSSEFALRSPSLLFGLLLIWLVYRLALALDFDEKTALLAALIVALLPAQAYYAAEARTYALLACLALVMMIAIRKDRPLWFGIAGVSMGWSHNLGFFYLLVLGLYAAWKWRAPLRWLLLPGMVASLWLPFAFYQATTVADGFWIQQFQIGGGIQVLTDSTVGRKFPEPLVVPAYLSVWGLTFAALYSARRWLRSDPGLQWLVFVLGVPAAIALASLVWRPVFLTRALLPLGAALALLWAYFLVRVPARGLARLLAAATALVSVACSFIPSLGRADVRGFLTPCRESAWAYATSIPSAMLSSYYLPEFVLVWKDAGDLNQTLSPTAKQAFDFIQGDLPLYAGEGCLFAIDTPMTTDAEREEIQRALTLFPSYSSARYPVSPLNVVTVYVLSSGEDPQNAIYPSSS